MSFGSSSDVRWAWSSISMTCAKYGDEKGSCLSRACCEYAVRAIGSRSAMRPYCPRFEIAGRQSGFVEVAADPAGVLVLIRNAGLPDLARAEVRVVRIGISDALNDGDHALVVHRFHRAHAWIESQLGVDRQHVVLGDRQ